ncbi:MAG: cob(I)yrinic acid a,c-diamide adenosyltransferase [Leptospirales bacterium]|nr:cob(I)yrinic acid a,c-diamide adenosyltransferase [Leptospirales bacterium]
MPRILIFTGEGKGKTTAALGMALRAQGHGMQVAVLHFVKGRRDVGEVMALERMNGIQDFVGGLGFLPHPDKPEFKDHVKAAHDCLVKAADLIADPDCNMIILDEICWAIHKGLIPEPDVIKLLNSAPEDKVVVLTGRFASQTLMACADTVTEMRSIKHAFDQGVPAQKGIEK